MADSKSDKANSDDRCASGLCSAHVTHALRTEQERASQIIATVRDVIARLHSGQIRFERKVMVYEGARAYTVTESEWRRMQERKARR